MTGPIANSASISSVDQAANKRSLIFLSVVMLINALSYGTIIPLLYPYAARFGIDALGLSLLFASFSLFQFLSTPIIGRLSDIYGRRPLLLISLLGTSMALALFASATSAVMLFAARILDGITGGNMSVAQAVIADRVEGKERAKAFGLLGASFGFGFLAGPALGGLLSGISLTAPFWFGSALAFSGTLFGFFFLDESLHKDHRSSHGDEPIINLKAIATALKLPVRGLLFLTVFIASLAQNSFFIGFQSYTVDVLSMNPQQTGLLFAASGVVNIVMQLFGIRFLLKKFDNHEHIVLFSQAGAAIGLAALVAGTNVLSFTLLLFIFMIFNAPIQTVVASMISERAESKEQGKMLGMSNSFMSLGQIIGPIMAGMVALLSVRSIFLLGSVLLSIGFVVLYRATQKANLQAKVPVV